MACIAVGGERAGEIDLKAFKEAYASPKVEERLLALKMLEGNHHSAVFIALTLVVKLDDDKGIRLKAFGMLAGWPDPKGRLAETLVPIFEAETHDQTKAAMCEYLPRLPVKVLALDALVAFVKSKRRPYPESLAVFNQMTGQNFVRDDKTFLEVPKWWKLSRAEFQEADAKTLQKLEGRTTAKGTLVVPP
jgi:hypothetical protein